MIELDGVPQSFMELTDGVRFIRLIYRIISYEGFDSMESAGRAVDKIRERISDAFPDNVKQNNCAIVIWRTRPKVAEIDEEAPIHTSQGWKLTKTGKKLITVYCRFATSPPLPEKFWEVYEKKEGEKARPASELK